MWAKGSRLRNSQGSGCGPSGLTFTQVRVSFEVPLPLGYNVSYSPGEEKNFVSIWYLYRILEGVDGFNYKC